MKSLWKRHTLGYVAIALIPLLSCDKEKKSDPAETSGNKDTKQVGEIAVTDNEFAVTYPEGMAITAFPQSVDPSPGTAAAGTVAIDSAGLALVDCNNLPPPPEPIPPECNQDGAQQPQTSSEFDPFKKHPKERLNERVKRLSGEGDCFSDDIVRALTYRDRSEDVCYGFDYGIVSGTTMGSADVGKLNAAIDSAADQTLPSIKEALSKITGLQPPANKESCMVATGRKVVSVAAAQVEGALAVVEGMLCQAKKNGLTALPDVGAALDLKDVFKDYPNATFSKAELTRLEDRAGRQRYRTVIELTVNGSTLQNQSFRMRLFHSPGADGNATYDGILMFEGDSYKGSEYTDLSSISYSKSGVEVADQKLKFEIRRATLNTEKVSRPYFTKGGRFNYGSVAAADGSFGAGDQNSYLSNIDFFTFDINPSSYAGKIAFWKNPGGSFNEMARGFVYNTEQNADGTLAGCAYAGASDYSIRKAIRLGTPLKPTGCFTPFIENGVCGNPGNNIGPQVFGQCFKQGSDGYYAVDEAKTSGDDGIDILPTAADASIPDVDASAAGEIGDVADE